MLASSYGIPAHKTGGSSYAGLPPAQASKPVFVPLVQLARKQHQSPVQQRIYENWLAGKDVFDSEGFVQEGLDAESRRTTEEQSGGKPPKPDPTNSSDAAGNPLTVSSGKRQQSSSDNGNDDSVLEKNSEEKPVSPGSGSEGSCYMSPPVKRMKRVNAVEDGGAPCIGEQGDMMM